MVGDAALRLITSDWERVAKRVGGIAALKLIEMVEKVFEPKLKARLESGLDLDIEEVCIFEQSVVDANPGACFVADVFRWILGMSLGLQRLT